MPVDGPDLTLEGGPVGDDTAAIAAIRTALTPEELAEYAANLSGALETVETYLLGGKATLNRIEVAERVGVPLDLAHDLWRALGFATPEDDEVVFTEADVEALSMTKDLVLMGIVTRDSQAALARVWGRSFARLAEWQTTLLAGIAMDSETPEASIEHLITEVVPRLGELQGYIWRRHLASASARLLTMAGSGAAAQHAVCFVDIVGYTSQAKSLSDTELVSMVERFERISTDVATDNDARVIKSIGDEVLIVGADVAKVTEMAMRLTEFGADPDNAYPQVRAGIALGDVLLRLGDVYGETVNIASRLTDMARPNTVLIDRAAWHVLSGKAAEEEARELERANGDDVDGDKVEAVEDLIGVTDVVDHGFDFKRLRRASVKGYSRLDMWLVRRTKESLAARALAAAQALEALAEPEVEEILEDYEEYADDPDDVSRSLILPAERLAKALIKLNPAVAAISKIRESDGAGESEDDTVSDSPGDSPDE